MIKNFDYNNLYNNSTESIKALQRKLRVKDDGIIGSNTIKALQRLVGTKDDGVWGSNSINAAKKFMQSSKYSEMPKSDNSSRYSKGRPKNMATASNSNTNKSKTVSNETEDVPTMSMAEYLYRSGSVGTGRRIGNVLSVTRNLVNGMINPDGSNASLSEGGRRQMVGASLAHHDRTGKYAIDDTDHQLLGGISGHSGTEFRQDSGENQGAVGVTGYISQAANAPYHNIFGQSGHTSTSGERFSPTEDGYTFNNIWNGEKADVLKDGEGEMSLIDSIRAGRNAYKSGSGAKAAIETAASHRGVNVSAGKSTYVDERDFKRYQDEYNKYVNMSPKERDKINKKFGYNKASS